MNSGRWRRIVLDRLHRRPTATWSNTCQQNMADNRSAHHSSVFRRCQMIILWFSLFVLCATQQQHLARLSIDQWQLNIYSRERLLIVQSSVSHRMKNEDFETFDKTCNTGVDLYKALYIQEQNESWTFYGFYFIFNFIRHSGSHKRQKKTNMNKTNSSLA